MFSWVAYKIKKTTLGDTFFFMNFYELFIKLNHYRSSYSVFCKKAVPINFAKFRGKHLCKRLFLKKVVYLRLKTPPMAASVVISRF